MFYDCSPYLKMWRHFTWTIHSLWWHGNYRKPRSHLLELTIIRSVSCVPSVWKSDMGPSLLSIWTQIRFMDFKLKEMNSCVYRYIYAWHGSTEWHIPFLFWVRVQLRYMDSNQICWFNTQKDTKTWWHSFILGQGLGPNTWCHHCFECMCAFILCYILIN